MVADKYYEVVGKVVVAGKVVAADMRTFAVVVVGKHD